MSGRPSRGGRRGSSQEEEMEGRRSRMGNLRMNASVFPARVVGVDVFPEGQVVRTELATEEVLGDSEGEEVVIVQHGVDQQSAFSRSAGGGVSTAGVSGRDLVAQAGNVGDESDGHEDLSFSQEEGQDDVMVDASSDQEMDYPSTDSDDSQKTELLPSEEDWYSQEQNDDAEASESEEVGSVGSTSGGVEKNGSDDSEVEVIEGTDEEVEASQVIPSDDDGDSDDDSKGVKTLANSSQKPEDKQEQKQAASAESESSGEEDDNQDEEGKRSDSEGEGSDGAEDKSDGNDFDKSEDQGSDENSGGDGSVDANDESDGSGKDDAGKESGGSRSGEAANDWWGSWSDDSADHSEGLRSEDFGDDNSNDLNGSDDGRNQFEDDEAQEVDEEEELGEEEIMEVEEPVAGPSSGISRPFVNGCGKTCDCSGSSSSESLDSDYEDPTDFEYRPGMRDFAAMRGLHSLDNEVNIPAPREPLTPYLAWRQDFVMGLGRENPDFLAELSEYALVRLWRNEDEGVRRRYEARNKRGRVVFNKKLKLMEKEAYRKD